jgi:AcrR family transcriptional regulator
MTTVRDAPGHQGGRPRDARATEAIATAALRQLVETGYARMSMESVAEEAGVARATIYRRFRDKADLVTSAIADAAARGVALPPSQDPVADVVAFLEEFDARIAEHCLEVVGCLLAAREEPTAMALHRARVVVPRLAAARALLCRARDEGALRSEADVDVVLDMLVGGVFARRIAGEPAERGWARRAVGTVLDGAGPRARRASGPPRRRDPAD